MMIVRVVVVPRVVTVKILVVVHVKKNIQETIVKKCGVRHRIVRIMARHLAPEMQGVDVHVKTASRATRVMFHLCRVMRPTVTIMVVLPNFVISVVNVIARVAMVENSASLHQSLAPTVTAIHMV